MKKFIRFFTFGLLLAAAFVLSCKKPSVDTETATSTDNAICEAEFTAVVPATNSRAVSTKGISGSKIASGIGPYIYIDSTIGGKSWPRRIWFDFDRNATGSPVSGGTLDADGRTRKGRLSMILSYKWVGTYPTTMKIDSFVNYWVDGNNYRADSIVIGKTDTVFSCTVSNGVCVNAGATIKWSGQRVFTFFALGQATEYAQVTGSANG